MSLEPTVITFSNTRLAYKINKITEAFAKLFGESDSYDLFKCPALTKKQWANISIVSPLIYKIMIDQEEVLQYANKVFSLLTL